MSLIRLEKRLDQISGQLKPFDERYIDLVELCDYLLQEVPTKPKSCNYCGYVNVQ